PPPGPTPTTPPPPVAPPAPPATTSEPAVAPPAPSAPPPAPEKTFNDLTKQERSGVMENVVTPKMGALMHDLDAKRFKTVGCKTCHGKGAKDATFAMPNP